METQGLTKQDIRGSQRTQAENEKLERELGKKRSEEIKSKMGMAWSTYQEPQEAAAPVTQVTP
jgi:hypothetical protein